MLLYDTLHGCPVCPIILWPSQNGPKKPRTFGRCEGRVRRSQDKTEIGGFNIWRPQHFRIFLPPFVRILCTVYPQMWGIFLPSTSPLCADVIYGCPQREPVPSQLTVAFAQVTKVDTQNRKQEQICSEFKIGRKFKISWEEGLQFNGNIICCRGHLPVWRLDVQMTLSLLRRGSWGITVRTGNGVWQNQLCGQFSS